MKKGPELPAPWRKTRGLWDLVHGLSSPLSTPYFLTPSLVQGKVAFQFPQPLPLPASYFSSIPKRRRHSKPRRPVWDLGAPGVLSRFGTLLSVALGFVK